MRPRFVPRDVIIYAMGPDFKRVGQIHTRWLYADGSLDRPVNFKVGHDEITDFRVLGHDGSLFSVPLDRFVAPGDTITLHSFYLDFA